MVERESEGGLGSCIGTKSQLLVQDTISLKFTLQKGDTAKETLLLIPKNAKIAPLY